MNALILSIALGFILGLIINKIRYKINNGKARNEHEINTLRIENDLLRKSNQDASTFTEAQRNAFSDCEEAQRKALSNVCLEQYSGRTQGDINRRY